MLLGPTLEWTPIPVEPRDWNVLTETRTIIQTALFRPDANVPQVLGRALDNNDTGDFFGLSVACSVGAEADTVAAHLKHIGFAGDVALLGVDVEPPVLAAADAGKYASTWLNPTHLGQAAATLRRTGFDIEKTILAGKEPAYGYHLIDSSGVREGFDVRFAECDLLVDPLKADREADLILINNLLLYLSAPNANQILYGAATLLKHGGIVSLGSELRFDGFMANDGQGRTLPYSLWLKRIACDLKAEFGVERLSGPAYKGKVAFERQ